MNRIPLLYPGLFVNVSDLDASAEFKLMAQLNGFITLQDILASDLDKFPDRRNSGMRMLREALTLLEAHGLSELTDD